MISWLPPKRPNGIITKYTVFVRILEQGQEVKVVKGSLPPQLQHYEAVGLKQRETYESWVAASTKVGQGQSSSIIKLSTSSVGKCFHIILLIKQTNSIKVKLILFIEHTFNIISFSFCGYDFIK